ncbi:MAG TPA: DUF2460 domain-containing protein [Rhodocyclaceae bacterium]|nr:DUF2460 domain-containing protein [Rhodocyclaceae bacterium]
MSNLVFPVLPGISVDIKRRPEWKTNIKEALNGQETSTAQRAWPRWRYTLSFEVLRSDHGFAERQKLQAFFNKHRGSFESFLFVDDEDNAVVEQSFGTGDGVATMFQLARPIDDWLEPVWAVAGSPAPVIKKNNVVQTPISDYSIGSTGQVQFTLPPAAGHILKWTGSYYMRCRFSEDTLELERFLNGLWKSAKVEIISKVFG